MKLHRRIQAKAVVEHETVSLRLSAALLRPVDRYAKYLGGKTDRTHVVGGIRPASPAPSRNTAVSTPALSAIPGGLSPLTLS